MKYMQHGVAVTSDGGLHHPKAVGFVLSQLGVVVARQFRESIAVTGVEPREFFLLGAIAAHDGASQIEVSELLGIPASTLVALVDHLEASGLVERRANVNDRRARTLHMTDLGRDRHSTGIGVAMGYEADLCGDLTSVERDQLLDLLGKVAERLGVTPGVHPAMALDGGFSPPESSRSRLTVGTSVSPESSAAARSRARS